MAKMTHEGLMGVHRALFAGATLALVDEFGEVGEPVPYDMDGYNGITCPPGVLVTHLKVTARDGHGWVYFPVETVVRPGDVFVPPDPPWISNASDVRWGCDYGR